MTNTRKVNAHANVGTLQQGDVVLGERVSGTTVLFTIPDLAAGGGGAVDSVNGQTGVVVLSVEDLNGATLSTTELNYVDGVTSAIQTQLNGKADSLGADDNYVTDAEKVKLSNLSGTNTGDQTSIVGITGTKAQFDTAVTDGNILYVGDFTQYTDELAQDAVGGMVDTSLNYVDGTPLLQRSALTGDVTASAGSNATTVVLPASATVAADDKVYIFDTSASNAKKYVTTQSIATLIVTPWVAYTPTFTGYGTVSGVSIFSRRVGDELEIFGKFTAGTSTATEARMTIGYNGTSANVSSDATIVPAIRFAGLGAVSYVGSNVVTLLVESNVTYITFGMINPSRAGQDKINGNSYLASGDSLVFNAKIPVTTWP